MSHILRAHQLCMEGYSSLFDKHLSTVWSAPNYCYRCGNSASILEVGPGQSMFFNVFEAAPENERDGPGQQMQFQQGKVTYSPSCSLPCFLYGLLHIVLDPRPFLFSIFPFPNTFGVSHAYVTDLTFILPTIIDYSVAQNLTLPHAGIVCKILYARTNGCSLWAIGASCTLLTDRRHLPCDPAVNPSVLFCWSPASRFLDVIGAPLR